MNIFLETKRLIINTPNSIDFDNLYTLQSNPDVMQYIGKGVRTREEVANGLERAITHQKKHGFSLGCVFEKKTGNFIGRAGLIYLAYDDSQSEIEAAYALMPSAWNNGYGLELAKALIEWGFAHLPNRKLIAIIHPKNQRSRRVLEQVGMRYVGLIEVGNNQVALYEIFKLNIDYNQIKLIPASFADYPIIQNIARFYVYDMSEYFGGDEGWEIPENGLYECIDFKKYWQDQNSFPFLVYYQDEIAGFAIVDKKGSHAEVDFNMAQFFILRKFKNKGIGRYVAHQCFKQFRGVWEVMVIPGNEGAYRFWRRIIQDFIGQNFQEYTRTVSGLTGKKNIFKFNSKF